MIRILQVGLGPLGQKMVQFAHARDGLRLAGALDTDPAKAGRDVGELCGLSNLGIKVRDTWPTSKRAAKADVALLTTVSSIDRLVPQVEAAAAAGLHVVSTCEELSYPWVNHPAAARRIDAVCRKHNVACVGTGVNPGYLMDTLPAVLTAACQDVRRIVVERVQDASKRRGPFQKKIGAGLTRSEFKARVAEGVIRHVGLTESIHLLASAVGWSLAEVTETIRPVLAERAVRTRHVRVSRGQVAGVEQVGVGRMEGREVIRLRFRAAVGEPASHDTVKITGTPSFTSTIEGGVNGDVATCAVTLNVLPAIVEAAPGLRAMVELRTPHVAR